MLGTGKGETACSSRQIKRAVLRKEEDEEGDWDGWWDSRLEGGAVERVSSLMIASYTTGNTVTVAL